MVGFFIERPVFASAIAIIMLLAGSICYFLLPVSQFPEITPPQVVVSAIYPGAGAQVVADTVTTPLEQQINGVPGMLYMSSSSSNDGSSTITITFEVGYPLSIAAVDVQNRVSQAAPILPPIVNQAGVTIKKQNPNFVLIVNLTSPDRSVDPVTLSNYAYLQVVDPLKRLPGVGDVQIFGERRYSMRIWLDPDKLAALGITAVDVQNAIAEQNIQVAAGKIGQPPAPPGTPFEMQVNAVGRLSDPAQFGDIIVRANPATGSAVRLRDAARIELGALQYSSTAFFGDEPTVVLGIFQMPGSNALDLQNNIKAKMEELSKRFPKGISYAMHYDTTRFVSAAMHDVVITLVDVLNGCVRVIEDRRGARRILVGNGQRANRLAAIAHLVPVICLMIDGRAVVYPFQPGIDTLGGDGVLDGFAVCGREHRVEPVVAEAESRGHFAGVEKVSGVPVRK